MLLNDIYQGAGRLANIVAGNEVLQSEDLSIAQECLSNLLEIWSLNPKLQQLRKVSTIVTDGLSPVVTLTERPIHIQAAQWRYSGGTIYYNLMPIDEREYYSISFRNITAPPNRYFWNHDLQLTLFPTPSAGELLIEGQYPIIADVTALTTELSLPPGYAVALKYALASLLMLEYGKNDTGGIQNQASALIDKIAIQNQRPDTMRGNLGNTFGKPGSYSYVPLINKTP